MRLNELFYALDEARSHPKQNPKTSVNQHIIDAVDRAKSSGKTIAGELNCFISLTSIDKLGINPHSVYKTPLGIYSYPASYVVKVVKDDAKLNVLPFAGDEPYVNIFSAQGNIIDLGSITDVEVSNLYKKIAALYHKLTGHSWKKDMDEVEEIINDATHSAKVKSLPGGQLWYVTMVMAKHLAALKGTTTPIAWNSLFREIGVDGAIDKGHGIIHTAEPTQAVFFSTQSITNVDRVLNKYSPDAVAQGVWRGVDQREIVPGLKAIAKNTTDQQKIDLIDTEGSEFFKYIKNPSEEVQEAAVNDNPTNIQYIKDPSEHLQLIAVGLHAFNIRYIKNPTEEVKEAAVLDNPAVIELIKNPSEQLQMTIATEDPFYLQYIKDVSEKVQMAAVTMDPINIHYIKFPTAKVKQYVASKSKTK